MDVYRDPFLSRMGELSLRWSREVTHPENKRFLQSLPIQIRLEDHRPHLLLVHGSPRKVNESLYEDRPQATFERIADRVTNIAERVIFMSSGEMTELNPGQGVTSLT